MEMYIKKTVKAGNSSAVILPRSWLNKSVRVELIKKTNDTILEEVIGILQKHIPLSSIIGIYLSGSHARNENEEMSDIDILVITDNIDKEPINEGTYSITLISKDLLSQKLNLDLLPVGQMITEAKPLMNEEYLKNISVTVTEKNVKWYLDSTKDKLEMLKKYMDISAGRNKEYAGDRIIYTLVLRIRTLEIIKNLIQNKDYSNKELIKLIKNITGSTSAYNSYIAVKNNITKINSKNNTKTQTKMEEALKLYNYLNKDLDDVKGMVRGISKRKK